MAPAAIKTTLLLYPQIEIATNSANKSVNAMKMGNANFLKKSVQHPMTHDNAMIKTDTMMITGVFTKMCLKV